MPLIFVSYDSRDSDVARPLAQAFRDAGFRTWVYEEDSHPGASYLEQIVQAIHESDVIAIVLSRSSLESVHVRNELYKGYESGKGLLPILRDLTHAQFKSTRPQWHQALMTNVTIAIPPEGLTVIMDRILAGVAAIVQEKLDFATVLVDRTSPSTPERVTSPQRDPWAQLESRLSRFPDEITRMRQRLQRAWGELSEQASDTGGWRSLALERVKLADEVVREVLDYAIEKEEVTPTGFALIARGGYGRGFLSEGSDLDISFLFDEEIPDELKPFWARFEQTLTDVWGTVPCLRVSPLATSIMGCVDEWRSVLADVDPARLASYCSFAFSRSIAGSGGLHSRLRQEWGELARTAGPAEVESLVMCLRERVKRISLDHSAPSFNLKKDAGGVLEFRLTAFVEQFLSSRGVQFAPDEVELVRAHEFFLVLRDHLHRLTRTPLLTRGDVDALRDAMEREAGERLPADELWERVLRHRMRVRAGFKAAIEALAKAPRESTVR